jgi:hypothetical protein
MAEFSLNKYLLWIEDENETNGNEMNIEKKVERLESGFFKTKITELKKMKKK